MLIRSRANDVIFTGRDMTSNTANRKPTPLYLPVQRAVCPVCGTNSYSAAGIHPQCAMAVADRLRTERIKAAAPLPVEAVKAPRWTRKPCPRCQADQHVRRRSCECGYVFQMSDRD